MDNQPATDLKWWATTGPGFVEAFNAHPDHTLLPIPEQLAGDITAMCDALIKALNTYDAAVAGLLAAREATE